MINGETHPSSCEQLIVQLLAGKGLQGIADFLSGYTQRSIMITDLTNHALASAVFPTVPLQGHAVTISSDELNPHQWDVECESVHFRAYRFEIAAHNQCVGSLLISVEQMGETIDEPVQGIIPLGQSAALLCGLEYKRKEELKQVERQYKEAFLFDLLYSNLKSNEEIIARGKLWGWDLASPHAVMVMEVEQYQNVARDNQLVAQLYNMAEIALLDFGMAPILMKRRGTVIAIVAIQGEKLREKKEKVSELIQAIQKRMTPFIASNRAIWFGVGRDYDQPAELFRSFQEAKVAREFCEIMVLPNQLAYFIELGFSRIIYNHDLQELKEFYDETLGELIVYDQEHDTEFVNTLRIYLNNDGDMTETANQLFLHRNTLRYRLNRIEEILDVRLSEVETQLNLVTAFRIQSVKRL